MLEMMLTNPRSTAPSYDGVSFSVASQDSIAVGLAFSADGTKMFVMGFYTDTIYQYSLSTGFDLTTASYDGVSFSVVSQDGNVYSLAFSDDGTRMFVMGASGDAVYQYYLSTGFDLTTDSYDGVSFSVASEDTLPGGLAFSADGTKMFVAGVVNDTIYQYSLSTGFDLTTASYDGVSFSVASEDGAPYDIAFSDDGTKMVLVGYSSAAIYYYSLSTGFDLTTASYDGVSFSVASEDSNPFGVAFSADRTKMFVVGSGSDAVHQYSLP